MKKSIREVKIMAIKFADEIVKEIRERGSIEVPEGYFTGEAFEEWLYKEKIFIKQPDSTDVGKKDIIMPASKKEFNFFHENYGEAT